MKLSRRKLAVRAAGRIAAGDATTEVMTELAAHLIDTGRTREQELVVREIEARLLHEGIALATVTSARSLLPETEAAVKAMITAEYGSDTRVVIRSVVDPSVIAGVKIELPGRQADLTVRATLDKLTV